MTSILVSARRGHRGLYLFTVLMVVSSCALLIASMVDQRTLLGAEVWLKPLKFTASFALYSGALSWLLSRLDRVSRAVNIAAWTIVVTSTIEVAIIAFQAGRGQRSHFNHDSELGGALFAAMGVSIAFLYLATIVISLAVLRRSGPDLVVTRAVKAGLVISLVGMALGMIMIQHGGHAVGVPDGGPGLGLTGWSTTGGDLRICHFVGMHALQLLPLTAGAIVFYGRRRWDLQAQLRLLNVAIASYLGLVVLLTWQALRAQPLLSPDVLTITAVVALGVAAAVASRWAVRNSSQHEVTAVLTR